MAINSVTIVQDNKVGDSDLLPVHSPVVFLVNAQYTGEYPLSLLVDIIDENDDSLGIFRAIPQTDVLANLRRFRFVANDIIKGLMDGFDDISQLNNSLVYINGATKTLKLKFYDPDNELTFDEITVTFIHGAAQFGENPNLDDVYNNEPDTYLGPEGGFSYVYFYNEDTGNTLTINNPTANLEFAQDYDDEIFLDYDDTQFEIDVTA